MSTDTLIDRLWGEHLPAHPNNALQTQMAYLRRVLGGASSAPIETRPEGYVLGPVDVDIDEFEELLVDARSFTGVGGADGLSKALDAYNRAFELWRGRPYSDVADLEFAEAEIVRLEEPGRAAKEERCEVLLALGRTAEAVAELGAMVKAHPLRERRQELLVVGLYRSGRQAEALRAYAQARQTLADDLGIDPRPSLRVLERQVLDQDPVLDWTPPPGMSTNGPAGVDPGAGVDNPAAKPSTASVGVHHVGTGCVFDFIGRAQELERVTELLSERRLVTLTGPGGSGKTRLAAEVAARTSRRVHFIDFALIEEAAAVEAHAAVTIGAAVAPDDALASIVAAVGDEDCLVVFDTCEHVLDGVAALAEAVLSASPEATVLATSRRPLGLGSELAWPIPPLEVPTAGTDPQRAAAFELFVRRAREATPDFELDEAEVGEIAELCRSLDGLPLAIELAAAQMDVLSPSDVRLQLAEHRSFAARSAGPDRHRTLDATTAWSIGLLGNAERDMLYRLAVFCPNFDLDAAKAVGGSGDAASVGRFVELVRSSLVTHTPDDRFRILDMVSKYLASTENDPERTAQARSRHAAYYADLAARAFVEVRTPNQAAWLRRLHHDRPNLQAALGWCFGPDGDEQLGARLAGDIAWVWTLQGNLMDSQSALAHACQVDTPPLVRARVLLGIGLVTAPLGDHQRVIEVCRESADLGRSVGDDGTVAAAYLTLGVAQWASGDRQTAASTHDEAIALFDAVNELWGATICRVLRARTAYDTGDLERAGALLDMAMDDAKQTGDDHVIALAYEQYTRLALAHGHIGQASVAAAASLAHNEAVGYPEGVSAALTLSAHVHLAEGNLATAREMHVRALTLSSGIGHVGGICTALEAIAELDAATGDQRSAAKSLLITQRVRARRRLPLSPFDEQRLERLGGRLRTDLGETWNQIAVDAPMTSLGELVRSILGTG